MPLAQATVIDAVIIWSKARMFQKNQPIKVFMLKRKAEEDLALCVYFMSLTTPLC